MKRMTRRSSIFSLPPAIVAEEKPNSVSSFDTKFSLRSFTRRVDNLTEAQREAITRTGFGSLLNIHNQMNSKVLLGELIERWDIEKKTLKLIHGEVTITPQDVALILGLRVIGKPVVCYGPFSDLEQEYGATPNNREISLSLVEERLESIGGLVTEDFVRSFLIFTFGVFLFPNLSGKVDSHFLTYLEDLDKVHEYAWGEAVRQDLFSWIEKFKMQKEKKVQFVGGCLLLLQVWSYEHIDVSRPNLIDSEQFPRASRWESMRSWARQRICNAFKGLEEDQITWVLHPTKREMEIDAVKQIIEDEIGKEEDSVGQSSGSSSAVIECDDDDSEACNLETKEIASLECALNEDLDKKIQFRQEIAPDATSEIPISCLETEEMVESECLQVPDSDIDEDLVSEASGPSFDTPVDISKVPVTPCCTKDLENKDHECVESISQKIGTLQLQELKELKQENVVLRAEIVKLKEENTDLKTEVETLKGLNNRKDSCYLGLKGIISEWTEWTESGL